MAISYFLKIPGVAGESRNAQHVDEIEVDSYTFAETVDIVISGSGGGARAGRVKVAPFEIVARSSAASPPLFLACAKGIHYPSATLSAVRGGSTPFAFLTWTLTQVLVSGFEQSGSSDGAFDHFSLVYSKAKLVETPQKADGSAGAAVTGEFDFTSRK